MTRRELREHVFMQLFTSQFYPQSGDDREEQMQLYFTHLEGDGIEYPPEGVSEDGQEEILNKVQAVFDHLSVIDPLIEETSVGWTLERMNRADLSILRLGVYELLYDDTIPSGVAINEAVLLARKFGGEDSYSFVNGILGRIQKDHDARPEQTDKTEQSCRTERADSSEQ